jgi:hypothetical protein
MPTDTRTDERNNSGVTSQAQADKIAAERREAAKKAAADTLAEQRAAEDEALAEQRKQEDETIAKQRREADRHVASARARLTAAAESLNTTVSAEPLNSDEVRIANAEMQEAVKDEVAAVPAS